MGGIRIANDQVLWSTFGFPKIPDDDADRWGYWPWMRFEAVHVAVHGAVRAIAAC